jgi:hypothetical protein
VKKQTAKTRSPSRAERPSVYDYNTTPRPVHLHAAAAVPRQRLEELFDALDRADETFEDDARDGALEALAAVSIFLTSSPLDGAGRFSRPLRLLRDELMQRPRNPDFGRILPPEGGGAGGVNSGRSGDTIKAAAACALEWLHSGTRMPVKEAAALVARTLSARKFKFGGRRKDGQLAITAWRRDYFRNAKSPSPIATLCQVLNERRPIALLGNVAADRQTIVGWLEQILARSGYGPTAK